MNPLSPNTPSEPVPIEQEWAESPRAGVSIISAEPLCEKTTIEEISAWAELGDRAEALGLAENFLAQQESYPIRNQALYLTMLTDDLPAATRHALAIFYRHRSQSAGNPLLSIVLDNGGYAREAYEIARADYRANADSISPYNLACRAWSVGNREESLRATLQTFQFYLQAEPELAKSHLRKLFLDSDLRGLWAWLKKRPPTAADAIRWAHHPIEYVLELNFPPLPPRLIDVADLDEIPDKFRSLLAVHSPSTKQIHPTRAKENWPLFLEYLKWETQFWVPSVLSLRGWSSLLRDQYDALLPHMVQFCAKRGRPGTARYLQRQFLRRHPETSPDFFPPIPGLEYWTEEWSRLWQIDPKGTNFLIHHRPHRDKSEVFQDTFGGLSEELKNSGLGLMVLGGELFNFGDVERALGSFRLALRYWPLDEALHHNIVLCLCRLGRWDEAARIVAHDGFCSATPELVEFARRAIAENSLAFRPPNPQERSFFPTPSYGFADRHEDLIFLREYRRMCISNRMDS